MAINNGKSNVQIFHNKVYACALKLKIKAINKQFRCYPENTSQDLHVIYRDILHE